MNKTDYQIAREFKDRLSPSVQIIDMRVFGSAARGEATAESDLDSFIELEQVTPRIRRQIDEVAWEVGFEYDRIISTFMTTTEQLKHGPTGANPIIREIEREGIKV